MKTKSLIAALILTASSAFAQVPSYVPTNGLVGWWPFNGNANDESGNGNNGTVNGATLTSDRLGNTNSAYSFDGNDWVLSDSISVNNSFTASFWILADNTINLSLNNTQTNSGSTILSKGASNNPCNYSDFAFGYKNGYYGSGEQNCTNNSWLETEMGSGCNLNYISNCNQSMSLSYSWSNLIISFNNNYVNRYLNGVKIDSIYFGGALSNSGFPLSIGCRYVANCQAGGSCTWGFWKGKIDDIGIWNRALTQQEITALYNAQSCTGTGAITADGPTTFCAGNSVNLKSDVLGGTYQWKKNGVNISTNANTKTYKATATGSYTCVATCNGTALTSNAIAVTSKTNASATVSASGATSFCAGDSVTLNATNLGSNYSVQWYRTNVSMENATNYSQVVKQPGTYKVVTRNLTNGCSRISGSAITTNVNCRIAGDVTSGAVIQENTNADSRFIDNELSQGVHIYPNPNSGVFSFNYDGEETGDAVLQVINNMGQSIYQSRLTVPDGGFTQDLQLGDNITKGIYIVRLLINDSYHDSKVMVK